MFRSAADTKHILVRFAVYHDQTTTASFLLFYETVMKGEANGCDFLSSVTFILKMMFEFSPKQADANNRITFENSFD